MAQPEYRRNSVQFHATFCKLHVIESKEISLIERMQEIFKSNWISCVHIDKVNVLMSQKELFSENVFRYCAFAFSPRGPMWTLFIFLRDHSYITQASFIDFF